MAPVRGVAIIGTMSAGAGAGGFGAVLPGEGDWLLLRFCLFESLRALGDWLSLMKLSNFSPILAHSATDLLHF